MIPGCEHICLVKCLLYNIVIFSLSSSQVAGLHRPAPVRRPHLPPGSVRPHSQLQGNAHRVSLVMDVPPPHTHTHSHTHPLGDSFSGCHRAVKHVHEAFSRSRTPCHSNLVVDEFLPPPSHNSFSITTLRSSVFRRLIMTRNDSLRSAALPLLFVRNCFLFNRAAIKSLFALYQHYKYDCRCTKTLLHLHRSAFPFLWQIGAKKVKMQSAHGTLNES